MSKLSRKPAPRKKSHYERYFEGYIDTASVTDKGTVKVVKVYVAPYWVHDLDDRAWVRRKLLCGLLTLLILGLYALASFLPLESNHSLMVILPAGLTLAGLVFLVCAAGSYVTCPRRMTVYEHSHSSSALCRWSLLTAVGMAACGGMTLVHLLVSSGGELMGTLLCAGCYLAGGAGSYLLYRTEAATEYHEEENDGPR